MSPHEDVTFKKRQGTSGMGGQLYEIQLCTLLMLRGIEYTKIINFWLASNMKEAADFDDVIFKYHYKDDYGIEKSKIIFLQSKHRETEEKEYRKITIRTLLSSSHTGDFVLRKYLSSFSKIKFLFSQYKNHTIFKSSIEDCEFIIYTNAQFKIDTYGEHVIGRIIESDHILNMELEENNFYYRLLHTKEIIEALVPSLDYELLVKELIQTVLHKSFDMNKPIISDYHYPLKEHVIKRTNRREGMFKKEFIENYTDFIKDIFKGVQNKVDGIETVNDLKEYLQMLVIQLPTKFDNYKDEFQVPLPEKFFTENDIKLFLRKLKLFISQPNERMLGDILENELKSIYGLEIHVSALLSEVEKKMQYWWREKDDVMYLTKENNFFQEQAKVWFGFSFDVRVPTDLFTGREHEMAELHAKINRSQEKAKVTVISQMTSISGLGGIGKTELARKYIDRYANDYHNNIIWINAESKETLNEGFIRLAREKLKIDLKCSNGKRTSSESIIEDVYRFFSKRKCLFVFDNATNFEDFRHFLPLQSCNPLDQKPYVLITSRDRVWGSEIEVMDLSVLSLVDAVNLIKKGLNIQCNNQDKAIEKLVTKLQCFALAIRQSISYIQNENVVREYNLSDYLIDYEKNTKKLLKSNVFQSVTNDYIKTTFTTWNITIKKIRKETSGRLAVEILSIMAYISPDNIKRNMFLCLSKDEGKIFSAVRLLVKYSMINGEEHQSLLNIHRLVQEVMRIKINDQKQQEQVLKMSYGLINHIDPHDFGINFLSHLEILLSHIENWIAYVQKQSRFVRFFLLSNTNWLENRDQVKRIYEDLVESVENHSSGHPNKREALEKILEYYKRHHPLDTAYIAKMTLELSVCYENISDYHKQAELLEEVIDLLRTVYGPEDITLLDPLMSICNAYNKLGNDIREKEMLKRITKIKNKYHLHNR